MAPSTTAAPQSPSAWISWPATPASAVMCSGDMPPAPPTTTRTGRPVATPRASRVAGTSPGAATRATGGTVIPLTLSFPQTCARRRAGTFSAIMH
jgi:hypothetical protein